MLRVLIYRDIQRVNCSYKHFVQESLQSMKDLNAMPRKGAWKYIIMHVIFALLPSKIKHTSFTFKGKYKS